MEERWLADSTWVAAKNKILKIAKKGGVLKNEHSPFGYTKSKLVDFRGFDFGRIKINGLEAADADFSSSSFFSSFVFNSIFENITFDRTNFSEMADHGNQFDFCSFTNCKFQKSGIGYLGTKYVGCTFEACNFSGSVFIRGEFDDCLFVKCNFKNVDLNASSFVNCVFEGELNGAWFRGGYRTEEDTGTFGVARKNMMSNVSFEKAKLFEVNFSNNCDLSTIKLPSTGEYHLFNNWKNKLERLNKESHFWPELERKEADIFVYSYIVHAKDQDWFLLNCKDIEDEFGRDLTNKFIDILKKD